MADSLVREPVQEKGSTHARERGAGTPSSWNPLLNTHLSLPVRVAKMATTAQVYIHPSTMDMRRNNYTYIYTCTVRIALHVLGTRRNFSHVRIYVQQE